MFGLGTTPTIFVVDTSERRGGTIARLVHRWAPQLGASVLATMPETLAEDLRRGYGPKLVLVYFGEAGDDAEALLRTVLPLCNNAPCAALCDHAEADQAEAVRAFGYLGLITMSAPAAVRNEALNSLLRGERALALSDETASAACIAPPATRREPPWRRLTPRESAVLDCLRDGKSNKVIARQLDMQESTVKVHVRQIMRKLGAANRTQAAVLAVRNSLADALV